MTTSSLQHPDDAGIADDSAISTLPLKPQYVKPFEEAHAYLEKTYGKAPPVEDIMRLCLCKAPWEIVLIVETLILEIANSGLAIGSGKASDELILTL